MEFHARCLGAEIKNEDVPIKNKKLSEKQKQLFEKMAQENLEKRGLKKWQT